MARNPYIDIGDGKDVVATQSDYDRYIAGAARSAEVGTPLSLFTYGAYGNLDTDTQNLVASGIDYETYQAAKAAGTDLSQYSLGKQVSSGLDAIRRGYADKYAGIAASSESARHNLRTSAAISGALTGHAERAAARIREAYDLKLDKLFADYETDYDKAISAGTDVAVKAIDEYSENVNALVTAMLKPKTDDDDEADEAWLTAYLETDTTGNPKLKQQFYDDLGTRLFGSQIDGQSKLVDLMATNPELYDWFIQNRGYIADSLDLQMMDYTTGETKAYDVEGDMPFESSTTTAAQRAKFETGAKAKELATALSGANPTELFGGVNKYNRSGTSSGLMGNGWKATSGDKPAKNWEFYDENGNVKSVQDIINDRGKDVFNSVFIGLDGKYYAFSNVDIDSIGKHEAMVVEVTYTGEQR